MHEPVLRHWGPGRFIVTCIGVLIVAAIVAAIVVDPAIAAAIVLLLFVLVMAMVNDVKITEDELLLGHPIRTSRIARSEVDFARFEYRPLGIFLEIHLRDGRVIQVLQQPKMTSTELSGDPPQPGGAAYEITAWARK
ncbi:hypothetical protein [Kribbella sp. NPDC023855]|uniref:hypothetical protein n=1 Tax=Kribbella sp. NPDC023855 TaxID=3154698 RepID=UPI0033C2D350